MSIENIDILKPGAYSLESTKKFLSQYENDLSFLKSSKEYIKSYYSERDTLTDDVKKRLEKLNKSILKLETAIADFKWLYNL